MNLDDNGANPARAAAMAAHEITRRNALKFGALGRGGEVFVFSIRPSEVRPNSIRVPSGRVPIQ